VKVLPVFTALFTEISPLCIWTTFFAIDSDGPILSYLRDNFAESASWNGSKMEEKAFCSIPIPLSWTEIWWFASPDYE